MVTPPHGFEQDSAEQRGFRDTWDDNSALPLGRARDAALDLYREVIAGSSARVAEELESDLPELLWLYHLGIVLFWVHDSSAGLRRTRALIERTVPMVERLARLSRLRVFRPLTRQIPQLLAELRDDDQRNPPRTP